MPHIYSTRVILYFLCLAVLDSTVMPVCQIAGVFPRLLYLFICYSAFEWHASKTVYVAFWAGLLRDIISGNILGVDAFILSSLAFGLNFLVQKMERGLPGIYFLIVFIFSFTAGFFELIAGFASGLSLAGLGTFITNIFGTALYTSAILPIFNKMTAFSLGRTNVKQFELFK